MDGLSQSSAAVLCAGDSIGSSSRRLRARSSPTTMRSCDDDALGGGAPSAPNRASSSATADANRRIAPVASALSCSRYDPREAPCTNRRSTAAIRRSAPVLESARCAALDAVAIESWTPPSPGVSAAAIARVNARRRSRTSSRSPSRPTSPSSKKNPSLPPNPFLFAPPRRRTRASTPPGACATVKLSSNV